VGKYRFFIDLQAAFKSFTLDENGAIFFGRANAKGVAAMESDAVVQASGLVLPISVFRAPDGGFWKWVSDICGILPKQRRAKFEANARRLHETHLKHFGEYLFPTITATGVVSINEILNHFKR
jgi:hypothetical protein